ncbi:MAG: efflux transporter outer membrane subunit [Bacteroidetes bacterium]|nr:efflux transporter outer membrane subunit [Bacteroidota bacterium]
MKNYRYFLLIISFTACVTSCAPTKTVQQTANKAIPTSYKIGRDSINIATLSWKEYFANKNLVNLIDTALINNYDVMIALQRIEGARAGVLFNKGMLLPSVSIGGVAAIKRYGLYTMDGAGNATTDIEKGKLVPVNLPDYFVGLQTSWEADITGKLRNRKRASVARYLSTLEGKNWLVTNLVAEVASAYYELQALDNELEMIQENILLQQNAVDIVTIQKQAGAANELAVKQFQAQLLNTKSLEAEISQQIVELETRINMLLGRYPQPIIRDRSVLANSIPSQIQTGIPSDLLRNRPDIKQVELLLVASKADVKAAQAAFYPSLTITGGIGFQAYRPNLLFTSPESFVFSLVGGLSAPLVNRSAIKANFKGATALQVEALYTYQKSILNAYVEVYNQLNYIHNLQRNFAYRNEEVNVLSQAIETSNELFRTGRATYLEVLLTQQTALNARLNFIEVRKKQLLSRVNIYKALGGGWK